MLYLQLGVLLPYLCKCTSCLSCTHLGEEFCSRCCCNAVNDHDMFFNGLRGSKLLQICFLAGSQGEHTCLVTNSHYLVSLWQQPVTGQVCDGECPYQRSEL